MIQALREEPGVAGVHVMAYRQEQKVAEIVHESGVLRGRAPWRRDFISEDAAGREPRGMNERPPFDAVRIA